MFFIVMEIEMQILPVGYFCHIDVPLNIV